MNIAAMRCGSPSRRTVSRLTSTETTKRAGRIITPAGRRSARAPGSESGGVVINPEESLDFTCRYCSELASVESTKYRIIAEGKTYNITYVNPMGYKHNSLKFNCKLEKPS
jgi:hypothetical protein